MVILWEWVALMREGRGEEDREAADYQHKHLPYSTVTYGNGGSTFALRRSTLDFGLGGQRSSARTVLQS